MSTEDYAVALMCHLNGENERDIMKAWTCRLPRLFPLLLAVTVSKHKGKGRAVIIPHFRFCTYGHGERALDIFCIFCYHSLCNAGIGYTACSCWYGTSGRACDTGR